MMGWHDTAKLEDVAERIRDLADQIDGELTDDDAEQDNELIGEIVGDVRMMAVTMSERLQQARSDIERASAKLSDAQGYLESSDLS